MKKNIFKFVDNYYFILNPVLIFLTTLTSALLKYQPSIEFIKEHPIRYDILSYFIGNYPLFIIFVMLILFVTIIDNINRKTIKKLEKENENNIYIIEKITENIRGLFDGFLYKFAIKKANFTEKERVSLYIYDDNENKFILFGRYAINHKYTKSNRPFYIGNSGCISKSLEKKWHFDNQFPSNTDDWLTYNQNNYNILKKEAKKMKMKSRLYAALRIDKDNQPLAIILVESEDKTKYTEKQIHKILLDQENYLVEIISALENYIPKPSNANPIEKEL